MAWMCRVWDGNEDHHLVFLIRLYHIYISVLPLFMFFLPGNPVTIVSIPTQVLTIHNDIMVHLIVSTLPAFLYNMGMGTH